MNHTEQYMAEDICTPLRKNTLVENSEKVVGLVGGDCEVPSVSA